MFLALGAIKILPLRGKERGRAEARPYRSLHDDEINVG
jgi:hypothetical protein